MSHKDSEGHRISVKNLVGVLTVVLVAAYFIFMFISYRNKQEISFYEVEEGSISRQSTHEGIILRNETVRVSETNGYVNFYVADGQKVSMNSRIYSIDENGDLRKFIENHSGESEKLTSEKRKALHQTLIEESRNFDPDCFSQSYIFKEDLEAYVLGLTDNDMLTRYADEINASGIRFNSYRTDCTGTVSFSIDGFEERNRNEIKAADFDRTAYSCSRLQSNDLVSAGTPVYKVVTDESWEIIFQPTEEEISDLSDKTALKISFRNHDLETTADFELFRNTEGKTLGCLKLNRYLIRFLNDRYVEFEIETNNASGLKIPEKSLTAKDFYKIPLSLKKKDARGNTGVYRKVSGTGGDTFTFIVVECYSEDDTSCYINLPASGDLKPGDCIGDPEDPEVSFMIEEVKSLPGAYNINKGYAVFKHVEELERANGYCIVKKNTSYGLSVYDHIILDASTVEEGQVLY